MAKARSRPDHGMRAERPALPPVWPFAALAAGVAFILAAGLEGWLRTGLALGAGLLVAVPGLLSRRVLRRRMARLVRARQEAQLACREKSRLLATITHELRTPMNGVIGMAGLLRETSLTEEQRAYVQAIESSGRALLSIVDEILHSARQEAAGAAPDATPFDPCTLAEEVCELLAPRAHARGLDLACFVDPALSGRRMGVAGRLRQVLVNLVGNAIKFTERGGVLVRVVPAGGEGLRFEVHDSGIGLRREEIAAIFEPFRQAPSGHEKEGAGLGLYISRQIIEAMGGRLQVRSRPGAGSVFFFTVPAPRCAKGEDEAPAAMPSLGGAVVHLAVAPGMRRRALRDYVVACGGQVRMVEDEARLRALLAAEVDGADGDVICDAAHGPLLRRALRQDAGIGARVWLVLKPEERRAMADLMESALAGFLLSPMRRRTFMVQFVERQGDAVSAAARRLRGVLEAAPARRGAKAEQGGRQAQQRPLVLLAEDNDINALIARRVLEGGGMRVERAADGARLLRMLEERWKAGDDDAGAPQLIVMDVHMPGMDGLEAVQRIRRMERGMGRAAIPVIALTANPTRGERARCMAAGMNDFLAKPFDPGELLEMVHAHLRRKPRRSA